MIKDLKINLKQIYRLTLVMSFPLIVLVILGWFLIKNINLYLREFGAVFLLTAILIAVILLFNSVRFKKILLLLFQFILSFLVAFKLFFYYTFGVKPTSSAIFVYTGKPDQ